MENRSVSIFLTMICASIIAVQPINNTVELQMTFLEKGMKAITGKQSSSTQPSLSQCILWGMSNQDCHAVNYDEVSEVCEQISAHGTLLEFENAASYTFVAFNNTQVLLKTDTHEVCKERSVQWREQWTRAYVAPTKPVYTDNTARNRYVCRVTVGDNEILGIVSIFERMCQFVLHGRVSFAEFYVELVCTTGTDQSADWRPYSVGDVVPNGAFVGGRTAQGTPLYVCRALISNNYFSGYYDPSSGQASIHSGSVQHPSQIDLLAFIPGGPNKAAPTRNLPCPRPNVHQAYSLLEWVEHWGPDPEPTAAIISGTVPQKVAVGSIFTAGDVIAKFLYDSNKYCTIYEDTTLCNQYGKVLESSVPYEWVTFTAGSSVPDNAAVVAHTLENDPLYAIMKDTMEFSVGQYDPKTGKATLQNHGTQHPLTMAILTIPMCMSLNVWSDKGFNTHSGPITAIRIQHEDTITGIKCRFGAQWSSGFWSNVPSHATVSQLNFRKHEYIKGVEIGLDTEFHFIKVFTNLKIYGPFGVFQGGTGRSMITRCGQVEFFSGQLCWDDATKRNNTFSFIVHGQICS